MKVPFLIRLDHAAYAAWFRFTPSQSRHFHPPTCGVQYCPCPVPIRTGAEASGDFI